MATAWKSGSTSRTTRDMLRPGVAAARTVALAALLTLTVAAPPARAEWKGNLALGYSKLFITDAPAGGFAIALGVNQEAGPRLRVGPVIAYHLLGTRAVQRGSQNANIDYSM